LPPALLDSIKRNKAALKGPIGTPIGEGFTSVNVGLRKKLELYANLRPVANLPSIPARFTGVDLVIVRENTEDLYSGIEHTVAPGVVESIKIITSVASATPNSACPSATRRWTTGACRCSMVTSRPASA